jgi:hypothetical protein
MQEAETLGSQPLAQRVDRLVSDARQTHGGAGGYTDAEIALELARAARDLNPNVLAQFELESG